jgi:hydroxymethylpyrimidine/phosphomethylpyrimidine kinase
MKTALTIAGSDSGGGAGIQADLKTFSAHGVYGMSVITAVTAQNTVEVRCVQNIDTTVIQAQIEAVFDDIEVGSVKIGMLSSAEIVNTVAEALRKYHPEYIVLDPVMIAKSGHHLLQKEAISALKTNLLPLATIVTPNIPEAEVLTDSVLQTKQDLYEACITIHGLGAKNVLLKGGHLARNPNDLFYDGDTFTWLNGERIDTKNTHGTGCTLSAAIASNLAKGLSVYQSIQSAKDYITNAIRESKPLGHGHGPVNHFNGFQEKIKTDISEGIR